MNLEALQSFLNQNETPKIKGKPKTFLGIAKQPHYENVLSNLYAFYFNVNEVHKLKDLFVASLLELIKAKLKEQNKEKEALQSFYDFNVETEYSTIDGGRIDLLLSNDEQAIIIENKVYHHIKDNDLDDYWNSIKVEDDNKIGVILSLHPIAEHQYSGFKNSNQYINITHNILLQQVYKNIGDYIVASNNKYIVFLNDFHQNIMNLTQPYMEENDFNFYFEHQKKIKQLITYKSSVRKHLENEVKKAHHSLESKTLKIKLYESSGNLGNRLTYYVSEANKDLMFTIIYGDLLDTEGTLKLIIELKHKALINKERFKGITLAGKENTKFYTSNNKAYEHFAARSYKLEQSEIRNLSDVISSKLEKDGFIKAFLEIEHILTSEK